MPIVSPSYRITLGAVTKKITHHKGSNALLRKLNSRFALEHRYFNYIEDHLEKLNAMKTLLDWKKMSHFFTSDESNDCKYRAEREFSSYKFVKKYCERSVVGREEKKQRSLYDDRVWKRLTGKNCIFVLGPSASGKTYST